MRFTDSREVSRAVALGLMLALAGCGKSAPAPVAPKKVQPQPPVISGGWPTVFADAKASLDLFGRLGFRPGPYEKNGATYRSVAVPTPMSDPSEKPASIANFTATGDARTLDSIVFSLDLVGRDQDFAKAQFEQWIGQAMAQLGVAGADKVIPAIKAEAPATGDVAGAAYAVTRTPIDGGRRLVVTFSHAQADAGPSQPRNG